MTTNFKLSLLIIFLSTSNIIPIHYQNNYGRVLVLDFNLTWS